MVQPDLTISGCLTPRPFGFSPAELSGISLLRVLHEDEHIAFVQTARTLLAAVSGRGGTVDAPACSARVVHRVAVSGAATPLTVDSMLSVLPGTPPRLLVASRYVVPVSASPASSIFQVRPISAHLGASRRISQLLLSFISAHVIFSRPSRFPSERLRHLSGLPRHDAAQQMAKARGEPWAASLLQALPGRLRRIFFEPFHVGEPQAGSFPARRHAAAGEEIKIRENADFEHK